MHVCTNVRNNTNISTLVYLIMCLEDTLERASCTIVII